MYDYRFVAALYLQEASEVFDSLSIYIYICIYVYMYALPLGGPVVHGIPGQHVKGMFGSSDCCD